MPLICQSLSLGQLRFPFFQFSFSECYNTEFKDRNYTLVAYSRKNKKNRKKETQPEVISFKN